MLADLLRRIGGTMTNVRTLYLEGDQAAAGWVDASIGTGAVTFAAAAIELRAPDGSNRAVAIYNQLLEFGDVGFVFVYLPTGSAGAQCVVRRWSTTTPASTGDALAAVLVSSTPDGAGVWFDVRAWTGTGYLGVDTSGSIDASIVAEGELSL